MDAAGLKFSCADCGCRDSSLASTCPDCGGQLAPTYEANAIDPSSFPVDASPASIWDAAPLLPGDASEPISLGEGATPLVDCPTLANDLAIEDLLIKDEGHNPTGTIADRACSVALTVAAERGDADVALPTTGADGVSTAAYAARAGIDAHAFVPTRSSHTTKAMINVHGGDMTVVEGRLADAEASFEGALADEDWIAIDPAAAPWRATGAATLLPELLSQRGVQVPDAIVVPTGHGEVLTGLRAAAELAASLSVIDAIPQLVAVQAEGCAPIVRAVEDGTAVELWDTPDTIAGALEVPDPAFGEHAVSAIEATDGAAITVEDDELLAAACRVAAGEGLQASVAGGAALAGVWALDEQGWFDPGESVVVCNTGAGSLDSDVLRSHLMRAG